MNMMDDRDQRIFDILQIDRPAFESCLSSTADLALQRFVDVAPTMATEHQAMAYYQLDEQTRIACVNWKGRLFITGTDIVRYLTSRYEQFTGYPPINIKKFEEGVFSDLRRLSPPQDCHLETTRSDFLVHLFNADRVRSKKKQKVFFWASFARCVNALFCDCIERELARIEMANASGMSIDEFIKSGIVPTGGASTALGDARFDWTVHRLNNPHFRLQSLDQIHLIRNDVCNCFNRHLRIPLMRRQKQPEPLTAKQEADIQAHLGQHTGGAQISEVQTATSAVTSTSDSAPSLDEATDSDLSPYVKRRRTVGVKPSPLARAGPDSARKSPTSGARGRGSLPTPPKSTGRPTPVLDPIYAPEDNFSVSTLSSDDELRLSSFTYSTPIMRPNFHRAPSPRRRSIASRHYTKRYAVWRRSVPNSLPSSPVTAGIPSYYRYPLANNEANFHAMQSPIEYRPATHYRRHTPPPIDTRMKSPADEATGGMLRLSAGTTPLAPRPFFGSPSRMSDPSSPFGQHLMHGSELFRSASAPVEDWDGANNEQKNDAFQSLMKVMINSADNPDFMAAGLLLGLKHSVHISSPPASPLTDHPTDMPQPSSSPLSMKKSSPLREHHLPNDKSTVHDVSPSLPPTDSAVASF
jgi:hypothetical protein